MKLVEKMKIHILCSVTFSENCAFCTIMWENMIEPDKP